MEGWDGTRDGEPSDLTRRRWRNFGISGAKLMWGGEAVAIRHDGRANPNQLMLTPATQASIAGLRDELVSAHRERFGANADSDLYLGLQITHSGRFARPDVWDKSAPLAACHHPILDKRFAGGVRVLTDAEIDGIVDDYAAAARLAQACGYQFVDAKACHGYLGHEMLGATTRPGKYGGSLENRMRFITQIVQAIRSAAPGPRHRRARVDLRSRSAQKERERRRRSGADDGRGAGFRRAARRRHGSRAERWARAVDASRDARREVDLHVSRQPVLQPAHSAARVLSAARRLRAAGRSAARRRAADRRDGEAEGGVSEPRSSSGPRTAIFRSGCRTSGSTTCATAWPISSGLGRVALSYPDLPADVLSGKPLRRAAICRTFSDCTTGPRMGMVSGCYPLDPFYEARPEAERIRTVRVTSRV